MSDTPDSVTFNYSLSEQERQGAPCIHLRKKTFSWAPYGVTVLCVIAGIFAVYLMKNSHISVDQFTRFIRRMLIGYTIWWFYWLETRYHFLPASAETIELIAGTADGEGIMLDSETGKTRIAWTSIVAATEKPKHFLLYDDYNYFGTSTYYKIPKRAFLDAALDRFRELVRASVPNARLKV